MPTTHLLDHYQNGDEFHRLTRQSQSIEFITTTRVLDDLLPSACNILELGAGPGRYTLYFAQAGHSITAIEPVPKHIDQLQTEVDTHKWTDRVTVVTGDHTHLACYPDAAFDAVLCMGPVYHLTDLADRQKCVLDCFRVLRPGGVAAFAYINKFFVLPFQVTQYGKTLTKGYVQKLMRSGAIPSNDADCAWTDCHYTTPDEVTSLVSIPGTHIETHVATDGIGILLRNTVDKLDEKQFAAWLDYHLATCKEPSLLGYSNHGLVVCRKDGEGF